MGASKGVAVGTAGLAWVTFAITEGLGIPAFFIFLALKLGLGDTTVADWSWWGVTAPLWVGASASTVLLVIAAIFGLIHIARNY